MTSTKRLMLLKSIYRYNWITGLVWKRRSAIPLTGRRTNIHIPISMVLEVVTTVADVVQVGGDDHHLHVMLPEVVGSNLDEPEMINLLLQHIMYGLYGPQDKRVEGT
jgi:hypothetical protein